METNNRIRIQDEGYPYFIAKRSNDNISLDLLKQFENKTVFIRLKDQLDYCGEILYVSKPIEYVYYTVEVKGDLFELMEEELEVDLEEGFFEEYEVLDIDIEISCYFKFKAFNKHKILFDYNEINTIFITDSQNEQLISKRRVDNILNIVSMYLDGCYKEEWMREDIIPFALAIPNIQFEYDLENLVGVLQTYHKRKHVNDHMSDQEANTKLINIILPDIYQRLLNKYKAIYGEVSNE